VLAAALYTAAMKPYHYWGVLFVGRIIDVQFTALLGIGIRRLLIGDVVDLLILHMGNTCAEHK
jgi:hypothetical protein